MSWSQGSTCPGKFSVMSHVGNGDCLTPLEQKSLQWDTLYKILNYRMYESEKNLSVG